MSSLVFRKPRTGNSADGNHSDEQSGDPLLHGHSQKEDTNTDKPVKSVSKACSKRTFACIRGYPLFCGILAVGACTLLYLTIWWLLFTHLKDWAPDPLEVRHITIPVQGLHPSLEGLTIGQISDLHFNNGNSDETGVTEETMKAATRAINEANVDLLVITGDFVDHWPSTSQALTRDWLPQLHTKQSTIGTRASTGIIASLGNHDYQKPESMSTVVRALEAANIPVLTNEATLPLQDDKQHPWLEVVGIGDFWTSDYRPADILGPPREPLTVTQTEANRRGWHYVASRGTRHPAVESPPVDPTYRRTRVVLAHNADAVKDLVKWDGIDLILSGHTHGGLSCFPTIAESIVEWIRTTIPDKVLHRLAIPGVNAVQNLAHSFGLRWIPHSHAQETKPDVTGPKLRGGTAVYINNGLTRGHPARWYCPAEVTMHHLVAA